MENIIHYLFLQIWYSHQCHNSISIVILVSDINCIIRFREEMTEILAFQSINWQSECPTPQLGRGLVLVPLDFPRSPETGAANPLHRQRERHPLRVIPSSSFSLILSQKQIPNLPMPAKDTRLFVQREGRAWRITVTACKPTCGPINRVTVNTVRLGCKFIHHGRSVFI